MNISMFVSVYGRELYTQIFIHRETYRIHIHFITSFLKYDLVIYIKWIWEKVKKIFVNNMLVMWTEDLKYLVVNLIQENHWV